MELAGFPLPGPQRMVFVVLPGAFHRPRGKVLQARRRPAAKAPWMTAARSTVPEARSPRVLSALTCAARRRRPQQQQEQEQRRGQKRGARARSFPAGVYVHTSGVSGPGSGEAHAMHGTRDTARVVDTERSATTSGSHRKLGARPISPAAVSALEGAAGALAHGAGIDFGPGRPGPPRWLLARALSSS